MPVTFQSANLRKKHKEDHTIRLTWLTTVLEKGQDPMGALLKKGRNVENRGRAPSPRPINSKESGESQSLGALALHNDCPQTAELARGNALIGVGGESAEPTIQGRMGGPQRALPTAHRSVTNLLHFTQQLTGALTLYSVNHNCGGNYRAHNAPRRPRPRGRG